jgi:hypothetical protein
VEAGRADRIGFIEDVLGWEGWRPDTRHVRYRASALTRVQSACACFVWTDMESRKFSHTKVCMGMELRRFPMLHGSPPLAIALYTRPHRHQTALSPD